MNKIHDISNYVDTVLANNTFFKKYYYHSIIDLNLMKLDLILKNGILAKSLIEQNNLPSVYTHDSRDYDSKNGNNYISLSEYTDDCEFNNMFESFSLHTLSSVSLLINKNINVTKQGERETSFDDEVFCANAISKIDIEGIIVPEHLSQSLIRECCCLPNDLSCYTYKYLKNWIYAHEKYFNQKIEYERIKNSIDQFWNLSGEYERPERWIPLITKVQRAQYGKDIQDVLAEVLESLWSSKYNLLNPRYMDIIMRLNQDDIPTYEISSQKLSLIKQ